jgi:hypothetical protein
MANLGAVKESLGNYEEKLADHHRLAVNIYTMTEVSAWEPSSEVSDIFGYILCVTTDASATREEPHTVPYIYPPFYRRHHNARSLLGRVTGSAPYTPLLTTLRK